MRFVKTYIRSLRNLEKRRYAELYLRWRSGPSNAPFDFGGGPDDPAHKIDLGAMAKQAVRMNIDGLIAEEKISK